MSDEEQSGPQYKSYVTPAVECTLKLMVVDPSTLTNPVDTSEKEFKELGYSATSYTGKDQSGNPVGVLVSKHVGDFHVSIYAGLKDAYDGNNDFVYNPSAQALVSFDGPNQSTYLRQPTTNGEPEFEVMN